MAKLVLPQIAVIMGTIALIKEMDGAEYEVLRRDTVALTIVDFEERLHTVWISKSQVEEYGIAPQLFIGNIVTVNVNKNIAGETYYIDAEGEEQEHDQTFDSFVNLIGTMPLNMHMKGVPAFIIEEVVKTRQERIESTPQRAPRFHKLRREVADEDKEAQIQFVLGKVAQTRNPIILNNLKLRLQELGYQEEPDKENAEHNFDALRAELAKRGTSAARKAAINAILTEAGEPVA